MFFTLKGAMGVLGGGYEQIKRITQRKKSQAKRISRDCWSISDDYITLGKGERDIKFDKAQQLADFFRS